MIKESKKRVYITIDKVILEQARQASDEWGLTLSQYFQQLANADVTVGLTAQARCMTSIKVE